MSADTTVKGEISQKLNLESYVQWTIEDINCDPAANIGVDTEYFSPTFSILGSEWYLQLCPNGEIEHDSVGWIGLYLMRSSDDSITPIEVNCNLGVKKVDGKVEVIMPDVNYVFDEEHDGYGKDKFLERRQLRERKLELAPSGALTIACTIRMKDAMDCTSSLNELSHNFKNMFLSAKGCDVTLNVQNKEFSVHRSILASRSSVFESMFEVSMKEKNTGRVDIVDCDPEAFNDFLVYMYSGQFKVSSGKVFELYKIAHKYFAEELKSFCVRSILKNISVDNVVDVAILGDQFDEKELKSKSQDFFNEKFDEVFPTNAWIALLGKRPSLANQLLINMAKKHKNKIG